MAAPQIISHGLGVPAGVSWMLTLGLGGFEIWQVYQGLERHLDPDDWGGAPDVYLEIHAFTSDAARPLKAHLYNETLAAIVSGSEISVSELVQTWHRSAAFALAAGLNIYKVRYGNIAGGGAFDYDMEDAVLLIDPTP